MTHYKISQFGKKKKNPNSEYRGPILKISGIIPVYICILELFSSDIGLEFTSTTIITEQMPCTSYNDHIISLGGEVIIRTHKTSLPKAHFFY
jgi:hypothetical protein